MKKMNKKFCFLLSVVLILSSCTLFAGNKKQPGEDDIDNPAATFEKSFALEYQKYTGINPLKGFMDFDGDNKDIFPHSLEYIPINLETVMKSENVIDFSPVEEKLNSCASSGHQAVIRFIMDTPNETCHIPQYIKSRIDTFNYSFEGSSGITPDYNDDFFIKEISNFIKAFSKYDGDPRIASIQTGIIGHWGEQHIYLVENSNGYSEKWNIKNSTWEKFFDTWGINFTKTKLSTRNPSHPGHNKYNSIGYYNDMICSKDDDLYFDELLKSKNSSINSWKTSHVSGEIAPGLQESLISQIVNKKYNSDLYTKYLEDLSSYHISCAIFSMLFEQNKTLLKNNSDAILEAQSFMGYDLFIDKAKISYDDKENFSVSIHTINKGVAPFPYKWEVELALYDGNEISYSADTNWDFSSIINEASSKTLSFEESVHIDKNKEYSVLIRVKNPLKNGYCLRFSNKTQDKDLSDYLTIGKIKSFL